MKEREQIRFIEKNIIISGENLDELEFSNWIKNLEKESYVKEVKVVNYSNKNSQASKFSLNLNLK